MPGEKSVPIDTGCWPQKRKLYLKLGRQRLLVAVGGTGIGTFFITALNEKYIKLNLELKTKIHAHRHTNMQKKNKNLRVS